LGSLATIVLIAVLTPGIYPRLVDRSADRIVPASKEETAATPLPPSPSPPAPEVSTAVPGRVNRVTIPQASLPAPAPRTSAEDQRGQARAEERQVPPVPRAAAVPAPSPQAVERGEPPAAAGPVPPPASLAARGAAPQAAVAPEPVAPSVPAPAPLQRQAAAKSRGVEGSGFVVQLSAQKSEAEAQATFQTLKSKYAELAGREPIVRRKDQGRRGVSYAVQVGPFETQQAAAQLCARIKAAGGSCFATKN
jgi:cell division septation protein DedD